MAHKIDGPGAGPGGTFVEASPGVPKTIHVAKWLNMIQDELIALLDAAGIAPDDANEGQVRVALDILFGSAGASALKNRLINGAVDFWQRGSSRAVGNLETYTADRWAAIADQSGAGAGAATISRQAFAAGQTDVPGNPPLYLRWVQTSPATAGSPVLVQKVEDVSQLSGSNATLSFYGRSDSALLVTMRLVQTFGSGGSADVVVGSTTVALGPAWSAQHASFAIPSIAGKTVGPASHLRYELILPAAATFTLELVQLQLESGQNATPFERRTLGLEYALAARFFEKSYRLDDSPGTATGPTAKYGPQSGSEPGATDHFYRDMVARFRIPKRARPTMTWYGVEGAGLLPGTVSQYVSVPTPGTFQENRSVSSVSEQAETTTGFPVTTGNSSSNGGSAHWTADAEL